MEEWLHLVTKDTVVIIDAMALIIVVIFIVVTLLALGSALLYSWYLTVR